MICFFVPVLRGCLSYAEKFSNRAFIPAKKKIYIYIYDSLKGKTVSTLKFVT